MYSKLQWSRNFPLGIYMRDEDARQSKVCSESHSCMRADADVLRKILDNKIESPPDMNFRRFAQRH